MKRSSNSIEKLLATSSESSSKMQLEGELKTSDRIVRGILQNVLARAQSAGILIFITVPNGVEASTLETGVMVTGFNPGHWLHLSLQPSQVCTSNPTKC